MNNNDLKILEIDEWLKPYSSVFYQWKSMAENKEYNLTNGQELCDFASGYLYYGLHKERKKWVLREWLPNAEKVFLIGSFNNWVETDAYSLNPKGNGNWQIELPVGDLQHGDLYALSVHWHGGSGKRIPAWARRVVQDDYTKIFNAQVWDPPTSYKWKHRKFVPSSHAPLIYEAHIGMSGEEERVHTYNEFRTDILPKIKKAGYNVVQLMAIPEHPYYGSFGYHVSSFFAPSSRFGTPEELKELIDEAHNMGISVIMDLIHSHAVKNEVEGLGRYDGTQYQFFHDGERGLHPAWDSYCFNYSKNEVLHFLLSNIKYWIEEFNFDGYRFDGVTSMLYLDHGLGKAFAGYDDYFSPNLDYDAVVYFKLANKLIHQLKPDALSIAEDMSGLPGLGAKIDDGGLGFDYRMSMGVPDYWIKLIKEKKDEDWDVGDMFYQLTAHRNEEKVVNYAESHDQALVGDKTIIFRLIDKEMYFSMRKDQPNMIVDRGMALHKMIRLITASTAAGAYLNFMGNEFGHPEWIDFPREGNNWSYAHARRIWSIAENNDLRYHWLGDFDAQMIRIINEHKLLDIPEVWKIWENKADQVLAFTRGNLLFIFNFSPSNSYVDYGFPFEPFKFKPLLNTDSAYYGGYGRFDERIVYYTMPEDKGPYANLLKLYLPSRTAMVFEIEAI